MPVNLDLTGGTTKPGSDGTVEVVAVVSCLADAAKAFSIFRPSGEAVYPLVICLMAPLCKECYTLKMAKNFYDTPLKDLVKAIRASKLGQ